VRCALVAVLALPGTTAPACYAGPVAAQKTGGGRSDILKVGRAMRDKMTDLQRHMRQLVWIMGLACVVATIDFVLVFRLWYRL
jgi:hypothetical protein